MSTDAQFRKGQTVWYRGNAGSTPELRCITEVTQVNPAQYHATSYATGETTTCGESPTEPGAVFAL